GRMLNENVQHSVKPTLVQEQRLDMAIEQIAGYVASDGWFAFADQIEVRVAFFGGNLVADVQELPQARVEIAVLRVGSQGGNVLRGAPGGTHRSGRELPAVDVNDAGVRSAQFVHVRERFGVNVFRELETFAAVLGQANNFLEPGRAGGLEMEAGLMLSDCPA